MVTFEGTVDAGEEYSESGDSDISETPAPKRSKSMPTKAKPRSGKFKKSWNLPYITASTKGEKFARCKLCYCDFSVAHGG
jgi:hypothetical protein